MMQLMTLVGAYGKNYQTPEQVTAAWEAGKDFKIIGGPYCSIRDIEEMKRMAVVITIRYGLGQLMTLHNGQRLDKLSGII